MRVHEIGLIVNLADDCVALALSCPSGRINRV